MEKFGLLNLLKALNGLNEEQNDTPPAGGGESFKPNGGKSEVKNDGQSFEMPNFMYEALIRHEQVSNRLKNKKPRL